MGEGPRSKLHRRRSSVSVGGIKAEAETVTANLSPKIRNAVLSAVDRLDVDGDGKVVSGEIVAAVVKSAEHAAGKDKTSRRQWALIGILLAVVALLAGSNFFTSDAAVKKNKEMVVGSSTGSALLTTDLLPVATSVNEIDVALPAIAWLTEVVHEFPNYIAFRSGCEEKGDAALRHEEVSGVVVEKEKSVIVSTAMGTKISWHREEDASVVNFALEDGTQWTKPVGCEACTVLNMVMNEDVQQGIEKLHRDLDMVLHREGRVLQSGGEGDDKCVTACATDPSTNPGGEGNPGGEAGAENSPPPPGGTGQSSSQPTPMTPEQQAAAILDNCSSQAQGNSATIYLCIAYACAGEQIPYYRDCCYYACQAVNVQQEDDAKCYAACEATGYAVNVEQNAPDSDPHH